MKKPTIFLLMFFAFITILSAQNRGTFASVQNGAWTDPATWGGTTTPSVGDKVTSSDTVQLDTSITGNGLAKLTVTSTGSLIQDADQTAGLIMATGSTLTVDGYMEVNKLEIKHSFWSSETITVNGTLIIHGDFKRGGTGFSTPVEGDGTVSAESYTNPGFGSNDTIFGVPQSDLEDGQSYGGATWKGGAFFGGKVEWSNGSNWYSGSVPTSSQDVVIMDRSYEPVISSSGMKYANSLLIQHGASLTINSSANLTITDTTLNGIIIQSDSTESGSLIYYSNINGVNNPKATVQRYVKKDRWNMVSPSTTDVTGQTFYGTTDSDSWLTYFVESEGADGGSAGDGWHFITNVNVSDSVGKGYTYWPTIDETVEFKGELRSTDISPNIAYSGSGYGYNLLGNPFSSSLLWDGSTAWGLSNMESTIWIWDGSQYQALPSGSASDYTIAIGQGFFVRATGTNPTLTIPSSKRTVSGSTFLKSSNVQDKDFNHLVITVQNNQYKDEVFIYFDESGTEDFDNGYDATKMFGLAEAPQIYLVENDMKLTYDFLPEVSEGEERTVALSYIPGAAGEQMLTIDYSDLSGVEVTLEDLLTGITQNLNSNSVYSFTGLKEDDPNRFLLHFAWSPNGIEEEMEKVSSDIQIYSYNKDVYIRSVKQAVNQTGNVFVYDMMGRELLQKKIDGSELVKLPVNIANNYVIVKVVKSGSIKTQKVFIK